MARYIFQARSDRVDAIAAQKQAQAQHMQMHLEAAPVEQYSLAGANTDRSLDAAPVLGTDHSAPAADGRVILRPAADAAGGEQAPGSGKGADSNLARELSCSDRLSVSRHGCARMNEIETDD